MYNFKVGLQSIHKYKQEVEEEEEIKHSLLSLCKLSQTREQNKLMLVWMFFFFTGFLERQHNCNMQSFGVPLIKHFSSFTKIFSTMMEKSEWLKTNTSLMYLRLTEGYKNHLTRAT